MGMVTARRVKTKPFKWAPLSKKQLQVMTWWMPGSPVADKDAIICDGAVRAGKTLPMSLSFVVWAMENFDDQNFGMAGKSIGALRRNVVIPLKKVLKGRGYKVKERRSTENYLEISWKGRVNYFYLFGGKDERSQDFIQGITLAGMLFDEVALMPESFVNQATARCSVEGAKLWFNCNPDGPYHWFNIEWLGKLTIKNAVHLHFTMDDNLSLSPKVKERYRRMYTGLFYKRYILGLWVLAEGVIYDMWNEEAHVIDRQPTQPRVYYVSIDYGTNNPTAFGLYATAGNIAWKEREYYYDSNKAGRQKTDAEYSQDLKSFLGDIKPRSIIIDPSALSFKTQLARDGFSGVKDADNSVLDGIRTQATMLQTGRYKVMRSCKETVREYSSYVWDTKAQARGEDKPLKQNDHTKDEERYFLHTIFGKQTPIKSSHASLLRGASVYG